MDGADDLGVLDAWQVDRGSAEVGVAQLTLDDVEGDAFVGQLDGVTRRSGAEAWEPRTTLPFVELRYGLRLTVDASSSVALMGEPTLS